LTAPAGLILVQFYAAGTPRDLRKPKIDYEIWANGAVVLREYQTPAGKKQ
jgi:hypothetical protein